MLRERVYFKSPQQIDQDPLLALRCFEFIARHGIRLSQDAEQRIAAHLPTLRLHYSQPGPIWPTIAQIFSLPHLDVRSPPCMRRAC